MSGAKYICKNCGYIWRTRKNIGRPANCPRCNSKKIIFDTLTNNKIGFVIGITGVILFLWSRINMEMIPRGLGNFAGIVGIFFLIIVIGTSHDHNKKNKSILKKFSNN